MEKENIFKLTKEKIKVLTQTKDGKKLLKEIQKNINKTIHENLWQFNPEFLPPITNRRTTIENTPEDIITNIFQYLDYRTLGETCLSNKNTFCSIFQNNKNKTKTFREKTDLEKIKAEIRELQKLIISCLDKYSFGYSNRFRVEEKSDLLIIAFTDELIKKINNSRQMIVDDAFNQLSVKTREKVYILSTLFSRADCRNGKVIKKNGRQGIKEKLNIFPRLEKGKYPKLELILVLENNLKELILPQQNIGTVICGWNELEELNADYVTKCLECESNKLKRLNVRNVLTLKCTKNKLKKLSASKVTWLDCSFNELTEICTPKIEILFCNNNKLEVLSTGAISIYCENNELKKLFATSENCRTISCKNNYLIFENIIRCGFYREIFDLDEQKEPINILEKKYGKPKGKKLEEKEGCLMM